MTLKFVQGSTCLGLSLLALGCETMPTNSHPSPFGQEFAPISELSPEYAAIADGQYTLFDKGPDGDELRASKSGYDYQCVGRPQEFFEFAEGNTSGPPQVLSRPKASYQKQFNAETFPQDMLRAFSDRSNASEQDAIRNLKRLEPDAWPPFGLADYVAFDDGWLIAYNIGEFGGALIWLPKIGDSEIVRGGPTNDLLIAGDVVFVAQGADHLVPIAGELVAYKRVISKVPDINSGEPLKFATKKYWAVSGIAYFASSSINKIAFRDGSLVGLTNFGLIVAGKDGIVRYNAPVYRESGPVQRGDVIYKRRGYNAGDAVQGAQDIAIDEIGRIYVAGVDMVGVYDGLPEIRTPTLYAKRDCKFDYGLTDDHQP